MDYTSIFTLMRAEVTLTAILVFVFLYDLMAGERARRRFCSPFGRVVLFAQMPQHKVHRAALSQHSQPPAAFAVR